MNLAVCSVLLVFFAEIRLYLQNDEQNDTVESPLVSILLVIF